MVALTLQDMADSVLLRRCDKPPLSETLPEIIVEEYKRRETTLTRKVSETKSEGKLRAGSVSSKDAEQRRPARFKRRSKSAV